MNQENEIKELGKKFDTEKVQMELLPPFALEKIAEIFTFGAKKYDAFNWMGGIKYLRIYGALQRHMNSWYKGESLDPESGKSHLYHAGCCLMMLIEMEEFRKDLDDRPKDFYKKEEI